jgi:hypothetical protein
MSSRVVLAPATEEDFAQLTAALYGEPQRLKYRAIALAAKLDGRLLGIGGVTFTPDGGRWAFCDLTEEAYRYPVAMHKAARETLRIAKERGIRRLVATATSGHPAGDRWLRRLGFVPRDVKGVTVYVRDL